MALVTAALWEGSDGRNRELARCAPRRTRKRGTMMALEGPQLHYARVEDSTEDTLTRALRLAREIEDLLEETPSTPSIDLESRSVHSTRMARAMAAGLVDELAVLVRGIGRSGTA
jgi:hypothetical protein